MSDFGRRIHQRRIELGMSQKELAKRSGCNQQNLSRIERGEITKTSYTPQIARALETTSEWLAYGSERQSPPKPPSSRLGEAPVLSPEEAASYETHLARWAETGDLDAIPIPLSAGEREDLTSLVFWMEVMDDAMAPELPERSLVLVDATAKARPKSLVLARNREAGTEDAVVRRYRQTSEGYELVPTSDWYPVLDDAAWEVIGRVVLVAFEKS